jgi:hypothetical protein
MFFFNLVCAWYINNAAADVLHIGGGGETTKPYTLNSYIKCIISPFLWVVGDVIFNVLICLAVSYDMVVKTGLPCKIGLDFSGVCGYAYFIPAHDGCQIF